MKSLFDVLRKDLVVHIDCTTKGTGYFEIGESKVVETSLGRYREASAEKIRSRFGYSFCLRSLNPHVIEVVFPDDKKRYMCISDGGTYDLNFGIITGRRNDVSNTMLHSYNVFWPRKKSNRIILLSWATGQPAAASEINIYELDEADLAKYYVCGTKGRRFGLQYEDAGSWCLSEGARSYDEWIKHNITIMKLSGQNQLTYPIVWYAGPTVPCKTESSQCYAWHVSDDGTVYLRATLHPSDWLEPLLYAYDAEGFSFTGAMTLIRLDSLFAKMQNDIEKIKRGAETYNNILFDGTVQSSCNDWTFDGIVKDFDAKARSYDNHNYISANRETATSGYSLPIFNVLHPFVQARITALVDELCGKYAHHNSFTGLSFNIWHTSLLWFGSIKAGYDDYSIALFETETGYRLPVDGSDSERFTKRYLYIQAHCLSKFIDWRCKKIFDFIVRLSDIMKHHRKDLKLTLNLWIEMFGRDFGLEDIGMTASEFQVGNKEIYEIYKEGGIDISLYSGRKDIEICWEQNFNRDNGDHAASKFSETIETSCRLADFAFLDKSMAENLRKGNTVAFTSDSWIEFWPKMYYRECDEKDRSVLQQISELPDWKAEKVYRMESLCYEDDPDNLSGAEYKAFVVSAHNAGNYYKEAFAHQLAEYDCLTYTAGGIYMDKAHIDEIRDLTSKFCFLPRVPFQTVGTRTDPVAVRQTVFENIQYWYAVNREPYEIVITLAFTDNSLKKLTLAPFGMLSGQGEKIITSFSYAILPETAKKYQKAIKKSEEILTAALQGGFYVNGQKKLIDELHSAEEEGRFAKIRHLLSSYPLKKTEEIMSCFVDKNANIAFIGDEIIKEWDLKRYFPSIHIANYGISQDTPYTLKDRFEKYLIYGGQKRCVILCGANEIWQYDSMFSTGLKTVRDKQKENVKRIGAYYDTICKIATQNQISLILCSVLPVAHDETLKIFDYRNAFVRDLNNELSQTAQRYNFLFVDLYSEVSSCSGNIDRCYSQTGFNLTEIGYKKISKKLAPLLEHW